MAKALQRLVLMKEAMDRLKISYVDKQTKIVTSCPSCLKETYYLSSKGRCPACKFEEDWDTVCIRLGISVGVAPAIDQSYIDELYSNQLFIDEVKRYLTEERQFTKETLKQWRIGSRSFTRVAIPFLDINGIPRLVKHKDPNDKHNQSVYPIGCTNPPLFGEYFLDLKLDYVIIVEGEWDAMALSQYGFENVLSFPGTNTVSQSVARLNHIGKFSKYYLLCDNDIPGQSIMVPALQRAWKDKTYNVLLSHKDANACLKQGVTKEEIQDLMDKATPYDLYGMVMGEWWLLPDGSLYNSTHDIIQKKDTVVKLIIEEFIAKNNLVDGKPGPLCKELLARFYIDTKKHIQTDFSSALGLERLNEAIYMGRRLVSLDSSLYFLRQDMPKFKLPEYDSTINVNEVWTPLTKLFQDPKLAFYSFYIWLKNLKDAAAGRGIHETLFPIIKGGQGLAKDQGIIELLCSCVPDEYRKVAQADDLSDDHLGIFVSNALILTFSEMQGFAKHDVDNIKRVLTTKTIPVRRMYTQDIVNISPMFVGIGSTNRSFVDVIKDTTGSRRFVLLELRDDLKLEEVIKVLDSFRKEVSGNHYRFDATPLYATINPNKDSTDLNRARDRIRQYQNEQMSIADPIDLFLDDEEMYFSSPILSGELWNRWRAFNPQDRTAQNHFYKKICSTMQKRGWTNPKRGYYEKKDHVQQFKKGALPYGYSASV